MVDDVRGTALLHDHAAVHEDDVVGHVAGEGHLVGDDDHRHVLRGEVTDDLEDLSGQLGIERGGRFVKEQNLRVHCQCPRDGDALLLSSGELIRVGVLAVGQSHLAQQFAGGRHHLVLLALLDQQRRFGDVLEHGVVGEQVEILEHLSKAGANLLQLAGRRIDQPAVFLPCGAPVEVAQLAAIHGFQQRGAAQQRGLARAGRPDDGDHLPLIHREADVGEHRDAAELLAAVIDFENPHVVSSPQR